MKRRDWRKYSKESLIVKLNSVDWNIEIDEVQEFWNVVESKLIQINDDIVTLVDFDTNVIKEKAPKEIVLPPGRHMWCHIH